MHDSPRYGETLLRGELDRPVLFLEVDQEAAVHDVEELVLLVVMVPVELVLHDAEPDDAVVHPDERLVVPEVLDPIRECLNVHRLQRTERLVDVDRVRRLLAQGLPSQKVCGAMTTSWWTTVSSNRESSRLASGVTCALVGSCPANTRIASIDSKRGMVVIRTAS